MIEKVALQMAVVNALGTSVHQVLLVCLVLLSAE
jgi:hypothetical protein